MPYASYPYAAWHSGYPYPGTVYPYLGYRAFAGNYYPGSGLAAWYRWAPVVVWP